MSIHRLRRALLVLGAATVTLSAAFMAGCGSSTVVSALAPARIVSFGDGFSDSGQVGGKRYTVNDGTVNVFPQQVAASFNLSLGSAASGGTAFGQGQARVTSAIDGAGGAAPSITQQISNFLAGSSFGANDLVIVNGGTSDITANAMRYLNLDPALSAALGGTITSAQMTANVEQAADELSTQVRRIASAGGKYVVVISAVNLGVTPWATSIGQNSLLQAASTAFNNKLLVSLNGASNVLYIDVAYYFNLLTNSPTSYGIQEAVTAVCDPATTTDPGQGIGTGAGKLNSSLCTPGTITAGHDYATYMFADQVYITPFTARLIGSYLYDKIRARW